LFHSKGIKLVHIVLKKGLILMEVVVGSDKVTLKNKEKKIGSEAPALRVKMLDGETKVIGMMADKVQCMITLNSQEDIVTPLIDIVKQNASKANIYLIASQDLELDYDDGFISNDFKNFTPKYGVNIDETLCAKSIFIINKDGEIVYKEIVENTAGEFDIESFDIALQEAIAFKKKGHTHENWMGV
jgi:thiol peroxidase